MAELLVDFVTTLDGYGAGEGWPGLWGFEGPEYLAWLDRLPDRGYTTVMGARTYRLMSGIASSALGTEADVMAEVTASPKVVFSSTLDEPLGWANTRLVRGDAVAEVRAMKAAGTSMRTLGSLTLCRSLLTAGLVDRFRVAVFPVITGVTGTDRIYDGFPDVALRMLASLTLDGRTQVLEYAPTVLDAPPLAAVRG